MPSIIAHNFYKYNNTFYFLSYSTIGDFMPIINYNTSELDLMARLMRAEALGEGDLGLLMVGNVIVNRAISNCLTFKNIDTIKKVVYQTPGGFSGINSNLFNLSLYGLLEINSFLKISSISFSQDKKEDEN